MSIIFNTSGFYDVYTVYYAWVSFICPNQADADIYMAM